MHIIRKHAIRTESRRDILNRVFHPLYPCPRKSVRRTLVKQRYNLVLEHVVDSLGFDHVLIRRVFVIFTRSDYPAAVRPVPFTPPAVEGAHIQGAVKRSLHPAGPAGLHRTTRSIQPHINPANHVTGQVHIIIFQKDYSPPHVVLIRKVNYLPDYFLALSIARMRLTREYDLNRFVRISQYLD